MAKQDVSIAGVGVGADTLEGDEKKAVITQVTSYANSEPAQKGWFARLGSRLIIQPTPSGHSPNEVYRTEPPPPSGPPTVASRIKKFFMFFGPGAVISVAYIDPDQYQTGISAGSEFQYKLLFMVLASNLIAIYIQVGATQICTPEPQLTRLCSPYASN